MNKPQHRKGSASYFFSPSIIGLKSETPHTVQFESPQDHKMGILFTAIPHKNISNTTTQWPQIPLSLLSVFIPSWCCLSPFYLFLCCCFKAMLLDGILSYEVLINVALGCLRILKLLHLLNSRGGEKANKWMDRFLQYFCLDSDSEQKFTGFADRAIACSGLWITVFIRL